MTLINISPVNSIDPKKILDDIKSTKFSGVVSIKHKGQVVLEEANGYLECSNKLPNNPDTRFGIASGTKLFTALGIMRLIELNKISLDDKALKFISTPFSSYDQNVTIKHLLTHTSGIPDYFDEGDDLENFKVSVPWHELLKPSDYLEVFPHTEMMFEPGSKFSYNNSAFVILAIIIEVITGNYYQWIEKEVLNKADMSNTGFFMLDRLPVNCANGYIEIDNENWRTNIYDLPIIAGGDGGMFTNSTDLYKFWDSLMDYKIITKESLDLVLYPHVIEDNFGYGLGVWLEKFEDNYIPYIVGEDPGVSFKSYHDINNGYTYNILSNTRHGAWDITKLL